MWICQGASSCVLCFIWQQQPKSKKKILVVKKLISISVRRVTFQRQTRGNMHGYPVMQFVQYSVPPPCGWIPQPDPLRSVTPAPTLG